MGSEEGEVGSSSSSAATALGASSTSRMARRRAGACCSGSVLCSSVREAALCRARVISGCEREGRAAAACRARTLSSDPAACECLLGTNLGEAGGSSIASIAAACSSPTSCLSVSRNADTIITLRTARCSRATTLGSFSLFLFRISSCDSRRTSMPGPWTERGSTRSDACHSPSGARSNVREPPALRFSICGRSAMVALPRS
mmetsp:Transcript_22106/g.56255  ORF Transcript_22106/g.56255 Transcript_22106/m.56255 type:complete len:202 (-) Transcript_22106:15-620(-)